MSTQSNKDQCFYKEIKPLEWTEEKSPNIEYRYNHCSSQTPFGNFLITWKSWKENDCPSVDVTPWGEWGGTFNSVENAKKHCQEEFDKRLKQCFDNLIS